MKQPAIVILIALVLAGAMASAEAPFSISIEDYNPHRTAQADAPVQDDAVEPDDDPVIDDATDPRPRAFQFEPGQRWLLTHTCQMTELLSNDLFDRGENASEFLLTVRSSERTGCLDLVITLRRKWGSYQHADEPPGSHDSANPTEDVEAGLRWFLVQRHVATVDVAGRIVGFQAGDDLPVDGPVEAPPRWSRPTWAAAVRTIVGNAVAYVPPVGGGIGETWMVARNRLVPVKHYNLTVATGGATHLDEAASCTIDEIDGAVAVVSVSCYREPIVGDRSLRSPPLHGHDMVTSTGRPNVRFDSGGTLEVHLDTGEVRSLSVTTRIDADEHGMGYVDTRRVEGQGQRGFVRDGRGSRYLELTESMSLVRYSEEATTQPTSPPAGDDAPPEP